jgi:hypothetical protein
MTSSIASPRSFPSSVLRSRAAAVTLEQTSRICIHHQRQQVNRQFSWKKTTKGSLSIKLCMAGGIYESYVQYNIHNTLEAQKLTSHAKAKKRGTHEDRQHPGGTSINQHQHAENQVVPKACATRTTIANGGSLLLEERRQRTGEKLAVF